MQINGITRSASSSSLDLKFGFKKIAKKNDFILIDEMADAFRHAGQNPSEDVIKDMLEKARALKKPTQDHLSDAGLITRRGKNRSVAIDLLQVGLIV